MEQQQNYFEKTLTKTDVEQKLIIQNGWIGYLLPLPIPGSGAVPIPFKDELGKDYTFWLTARSPKPDETYYMKPEFMFKEWHAFAVEKKLKAGEKIYLWWDLRGLFRIKVREPPRLHKLFGTTFLY
ncbi:hypothetical protein L484_027894 [Morus notabilis]|uniref:TF-B3 domain-containing protein n=1 Tax=Morus notabilis TaxID=981085 RepID=W9SHW4_9ROSA|nr:hypothetical protein L484_027894 [Morus notabilis]